MRKIGKNELIEFFSDNLFDFFNKNFNDSC